MMAEEKDAWLCGVFSQAKELALIAGRQILEQWGIPSCVTYKGRNDLLTETDLSIEKFLKDRLRELVSDSTVMAEESYKGEDATEWMWIVDPIDGTTNFVHRHPFVATSIALAHRGEIMLGLVNAPVLGECYWAVRGHGAFVNETRIQVSNAPLLEQSMIGFGIPYSIGEEKEKWLPYFSPVLIKSQAMRRCGAAAIDLSYVASGKYDGFYETGLHQWDVAAGWLIVEEAGGKVTRYNNARYELGANDILATNSKIHIELSDLLISK